MVKLYKKCLLIVTASLLFSVLIGAIPVCEAGESTSDFKNFTLQFLEKVANVNMERYNITSYTCETVPPLLYPGHVENWVDLTLTSGNATVKPSFGFMDGKFRFFMLRSGGTPIFKERDVKGLDNVQLVLQDYQDHVNTTHCTHLISMVGQISRIDAEQTIERAEGVLEFTPDLSGNVSLLWYPKVVGIEAMKGLSMSLDKDGVLTRLWDWWNIFQVGNTEVNVSETEAISRALDLAETHADSIGAKIDRYETELRLCSDNVIFGDTEGNRDCFTLYPKWAVTVYYDKKYGSFYGYYVSIWADTGDVCSSHSQSLGYIGVDGSRITWPIILLVAAIIVVPTALVLYQKRRHSKAPVRNKSPANLPEKS